MKEFIDLVKKMRDLQKEYFQKRDANVLAEAKTYERKVDKVLNGLLNQKEIFENDTDH